MATRHLLKFTNPDLSIMDVPDNLVIKPGPFSLEVMPDQPSTEADVYDWYTNRDPVLKVTYSDTDKGRKADFVAENPGRSIIQLQIGDKILRRYQVDVLDTTASIASFTSRGTEPLNAEQ